MLPSGAERSPRGWEMTNEIDSWSFAETMGRVEDMVRGLSPRQSFELDCLFDWGVAYLQAWDIYMWGEPNESSLLLRNHTWTVGA